MSINTPDGTRIVFQRQQYPCFYGGFDSVPTDEPATTFSVPEEPGDTLTTLEPFQVNVWADAAILAIDVSGGTGGPPAIIAPIGFEGLWQDGGSVEDELAKYGVYVVVNPEGLPNSITAPELEEFMETEILAGVENMGIAFSNFYTGSSLDDKYNAFATVMRVPNNPEDELLSIVFLFTQRSEQASCEATFYQALSVDLDYLIESQYPNVNFGYVIECDTDLALADPGFSQFTAVHELGHTFTQRTGGTATCYSGDLEDICDRDGFSYHQHIFRPNYPITRPDTNEPNITNSLRTTDVSFVWIMGAAREGYRRGDQGWGSSNDSYPNGTYCDFQINPAHYPEEVAADMFLNWIYETVDNVVAEDVNGNLAIGFEDIDWKDSNECEIATESVPRSIIQSGQARFDFMNDVMTLLGTKNLGGWNAN